MLDPQTHSITVLEMGIQRTQPEDTFDINKGQTVFESEIF